MNIEPIAVGLLVLAVAASAAVAIWAVPIVIDTVRARRTRRRACAAVYYDASQATLTLGDRTVPLQNLQACDERPEDTEPVDVRENEPRLAPVQLEVRVRSVTIPPAPLPRPPSPAVRKHVGQVTRIREPIRSVYTAPSMPADPSPVLFGDPVSLSSPSFEGHGGTFGGAGASGGWDPPAAPDPSPSPSPSFDSAPSVDTPSGGSND